MYPDLFDPNGGGMLTLDPEVSSQSAMDEIIVVATLRRTGSGGGGSGGGGGDSGYPTEQQQELDPDAETGGGSTPPPAPCPTNVAPTDQNSRDRAADGAVLPPRELS